MASETSLREGPVPDHLRNALAATRFFEISCDSFLLRASDDLSFHYHRGAGTVVARSSNVTDAEVGLFFDGSVYGAIAWLNGLWPLHASAVSHRGCVYAFTGGSGEGKSTLATGLAKRGFPIVSDDVLVLDLREPDTILTVPGHARVKLWADACDLTLTRGERRVRSGIDKFYVSDDIGFEPRTLPLCKLYFLESDTVAQTDLTTLRGAAGFNPLRRALYRPEFYAALAEPTQYFGAVAHLLSGVELARFVRPRGVSAFAATLDRIVTDIEREAVE